MDGPTCHGSAFWKDYKNYILNYIILQPIPSLPPLHSKGQEWARQRSAIYTPAHSLITQHAQGLYEICDQFSKKVYNVRNYQDEISEDLYKELHKWAFDSLGKFFDAQTLQTFNTTPRIYLAIFGKLGRYLMRSIVPKGYIICCVAVHSLTYEIDYGIYKAFVNMDK